MNYRDVDEADVYKGDAFVGELTRHNNDVEFRYSETYLDDPHTEPIAWSMPKSAEPTISTGGSVPPFFAGLLPEGARLSGIVTATKTSEDDHFTLLLAVGSDTIGDVQVLSRGELPRTPRPAFDANAPTPDLRTLFEELSGVGSVDLDSSSIPGIQAKVSAEMFSTPAATTGGPAILKLAPPARLPRLVENEHFFMSTAHHCGIPTPKTRIISDGNGITGLLVDRFDRRDGVRVPQEDACQVANVYPAAKYRLKTEAVISSLASTVEQGGGSARLAALQLLRLTVFSYLIGNGDLHGKNYSIHSNAHGLWSVTPAYDLLCTQPYAGWRDPMALDLFGRANRWSHAHIVQSARRLGVPERATANMVDQVVTGVRASVPRLGAIGFDDRTTERMAALLDTRCVELSTRP